MTRWTTACSFRRGRSVWFTFLAPLKDSEDGYRAQAMEDSLLYLIPHKVVLQVCDEHPDMAHYFAAKAESELGGQ
nr:hypothetical protein [Vibrio sp. S12_S33]